MKINSNCNRESRIKIARGDAGLRVAINQSKRNRFLLSDRLTGPDRPLELTYLDRTLDETPRANAVHYYMQDFDGVIIAAATIEDRPDEIFLEQVSVRPGYRKNGYALALIRHSMKIAADSRKDLRLSTFMPAVRDWLPSKICRLLVEFPGLKVEVEQVPSRPINLPLQPPVPGLEAA